MNNSIISSKIFNLAMLLLALPLFVIILVSFENSGTKEFSFIGYFELIENVRLIEIRYIALRSLIVSFISVFIGYNLSYVIVIFCSKKFQNFFLILITLPFLVNEAIRVFSWQYLLSNDGILNKLFGNGIFSSANDSNIIITMIIASFPFSIFICTASLISIPEIYWKVSDDLKLNQTAKYFKIALPMSKASILASFTIVFFISFALSSEVVFLGGDTKISMRSFVLSLMSANKFETIFAFGSILMLILLAMYVIILKKSK